MKFEKVLRDIEKLIGKPLRSISNGSKIFIENVSWEHERIEIRNAIGKPRSRPFSEIARLLEKLVSQPAIHVDSVLGGSGSSRNQPETILANLPYVEFLYFEGRKHIAIVNGNSHELGTIRQMDPVASEEVKHQLKSGSQDEVRDSVLVVTEDVRATTLMFEPFVGGPIKSLGPGIYAKDVLGNRIIFASVDALPKGISPGTYCVFKVKSRPRDIFSFTISGQAYHLASTGDLKLIVKT